MKSYSIYHGMDDEQKQPLGVAIFSDDGSLERVDQAVDDAIFQDSLEEGETVRQMAARFKSWAFVPEGSAG